MNTIKFITAIVLFSFIIVLLSCGSGDTKKGDRNWKVYGGTKEATRYSALAQIDTNNVSQLHVAWTYHSGDADTGGHSQIQCNPIIIDGILYGLSPKMKLFALDAVTGIAKWTFDPGSIPSTANRKQMFLNTGRGVTYWSDGHNDNRIFYTVGPELFCIDAKTGKMKEGFGSGGRIDLHEGLGRNVGQLFITSNTPGVIYNNLLIVGSRVAEEADAAPGHVRAFDVRTGQQKWIFHTIPHPGESGYETWNDPQAYKHIGGANNWSGLSLDEDRGIVFVPTGSASFDFYGGRRTGDNLFANCLVALNAKTGERIWHFQTIHHDLWDRDLPCAPAVVTIIKDGKKIDAVAQPTKTGFVFLFDRATGKPVYPINEVSVPTETGLKGEMVSPTQPVPELPKPYVRQTLTEADLNDLVPDSSYQDLKKRLAGYSNKGLFGPPSKEGTVVFPGFDGGSDWGGPSFDPETGILYINAQEMPNILRMVETKKGSAGNETYGQAGKRLYVQNCMSCHGPERKGGGNYPSLVGINTKYDEANFIRLINSGRRMMPAFSRLIDIEKKAIASFVLEQKAKSNLAYTGPKENLDSFLHLPYVNTGYDKFLTKEGYAAVKPPWGSLNAINLNTGEFVWKATLGEYPEFKAKGIITGTENYGGSAVTAGGLLFIAATRDGKFRVFNKRTGKVLWETDLPAPGFATPSIYEADGKQYVVIACGGGKIGTKSGDSYVAFSLPAK